MIRFWHLVAMAGALALSGCLPESEHPIAPPDEAGGDARLLGAWLHVSEDGYGVYHAFKTERADWDLAIADHDVEGIGEIEIYTGHTTRIASGDYLNVLVTGSETGYLIARYEFADKDHLRMAFSDTEMLVEAVKSGALPGTITEDSTGPDIRITASPEQWQAYLATAPASLFPEMFEMERVGPALVWE
jgi:hypothetical protein